MKVKTSLYFIATCILIASNLTAQTRQWTTLPSPPEATRYDDMYFVTPDIGWAIHPYNTYYDTTYPLEQGRIWKTTNGGKTWKLQLDSAHVYFRCVGFADTLHGWVCSLGLSQDSISQYYDSTLMLETTDGGITWQESKNKIIGTKPPGICGMDVINQDVAYAVGRWSRPAYLLKTTNSGKSWNSTDMNSIAGRLIDCHFWSVDSGIIVGGTTDSITAPLILFTSDGGNHWINRYQGKNWYNDEWCWKISFPTPDIGYVSVETSTRTGYLLKTTNRGVSWKQMNVTNSGDLQGVGFLNENVGWTGGWSDSGFATTNGGKTWKRGVIGMNLNRFHFFGDSLAYCSGKSIFKMTLSKPDEVQSSPDLENLPIESVNYPNPFTDATTISFQVTKPDHVTLIIYDVMGKEIAKILDENKMAGEYSLSLDQYFRDRSRFPSGTYFYTLAVGRNQLQREMVRLR